ncbi:hypothetical protein BDZ89DRAFT_1022679 [Hymenopellis radicata]|nr:hypothetical protein BDZ89DRAFT_1022679 [Hymenopellis radicata]
MTVEPMDDNNVETVLEALQSKDQMLCFNGLSQYALGGVAACGLASVNFARVVFEKEGGGLQGDDLVGALINRETIMDVISVCQRWPQSLHVEVETIMQAPVFHGYLKEVTCHYGTPSFENFQGLLRDLENASITSKASAVAVITRPPEIIACARTPQDVFVIFDSHNRPEHPSGAGIYLTTSLERASRHLHNLLFVDPNLFSGSGFQWQAQLLANYSAHIFVSGKARFDRPTLTLSLLETSLEVLALRAEVSDLRTQNVELVQNNEHLEEELENLQDDHKRLLRDHSKLRPSQTTGKASSSLAACAPSSSSLTAPIPSTSTLKGKERAHSHDLDANVAWQLQHDFDTERSQIDADRRLVQSVAQATFDCSVCLDTQPVDFATAIPGCDHTTCRNCLRQHIATMLKDHRYPVFCPACVGESTRAEITQEVIFDVGVSEKLYAIFEEAQLTALSIILDCRKCEQSVFVDRAEYQEAKILTCPLPSCTHAWCKACQQTITPNVTGPPHSCDGSSELDHLMGQQGWKYCPGCKTPVMKTSGCNHMTCMSPGCNTHFCYRCGGNIVQSALRNDIRGAVSAHYAKCLLFEVPR